MSNAPKWKETGGSWLPDHTLLSDEELAKCARAYDPGGIRSHWHKDCPTSVGNSHHGVSTCTSA